MARRSTFLAIALAAAAIQLSPGTAEALDLTPVDGGANYYARFSDALPSDPSYFPVGVWFESVTEPADVNTDRAAGLNLYVVLTANSDVGLARASGMKTIVQGDEFGPGTPTQGWFLADEVDMTSGPGAGYTEMQSIADALPNDGRIRYSNYGKGVTFWESDAEAARFVNDYQDVVSADNYWFTDNNICSGTEGGSLIAGGASLSSAECHRAANYGATVDRVRALVNPPGSKPVWAIVELGHPAGESDWPTITPPQVRAAAWQSLIAGARGIVYFNHSFGGPDQTQHILRDGANPSSPYAPIRSVVTATNREIATLAPVLNSPTVSAGWSQGPGTTAMVKWVAGTAEKTGSPNAKKKKCRSKKHSKKCKRKKHKKHKRPAQSAKKKRCKSKKHSKKCKRKKRKETTATQGTRGRFYVFAGSAGGAAEGRFYLPGVGDATATVVDEDRAVRVRGGTFQDHFADGNAVHIYCIGVGSKCASSKRSSTLPPAPPSARGAPVTSSHHFPWVLVAALGAGLLGGLALIGRRARRVQGAGPHGLGTR